MAEAPFGFTGEWRDSVTGMYYLRARYYNPAIGTFVSRDPYEGTTARAMSLNGYSWVEGRVADGRDPNGRSLELLRQLSTLSCASTNSTQTAQNQCECYCNPLFSTYSAYLCGVCRAFRDGLAVNANGQPFQFCGDERPTQACCGPDATVWLMRELQIHGNYASIGGNLMAGNILDSMGPQFLRLAVYGLAVDYGRVPYWDLAVASAQRAGAYVPTDNDYCGSRDGVISVCGICQNPTDFGNFVLGYAISKIDSGRPFAELAGPIFNIASGDDSAAADNLGVITGYNFGLAQLPSDRNSFCQAYQSLGNGWHDTLPADTCATRPCTLQNLDCASNSVADWNTYVSASLGRPPSSPSTPLEQLYNLGIGILS
jgi:RHS repeat-associated protein